VKRWLEWPVGAIVAGALAVAGAGAVILSTAIDTEPRVTLAGPDRPVNPGARNPGDISANNSPSAARNPRRPSNLVVANRIDTPLFSCALHVSLDGGAHWSDTRIPIPHGEERKCFAPDVVFTADGTLHMSYVTLRGAGNTPHAGWIVSSRDGGRTLSPPRRVLGPLAFQVRLVADPRRPRTLYLTWLNAAAVGLYRLERPGNPIRLARSDDGGADWTSPARVSSPARGRVLAPSPAVGPKGEVYVLYLDLGGDRLDYEGAHEGRGGPPYSGRFSLVLARSLDRGARWAESLVDDRIVPTERFLSFLPPFPSLAVAADGRVYAAFTDGRFGSPDVLEWSLAAGAARWRGPVRVNDTPEQDGSSQYLPRLAVAPNGRLDVVYYDRRADPRDVSNDVSLQSSYDRGRTFDASIRLSSRSFSSRIGFGSERDMPDLGSRLALLSDDGSARAFWADTRAGTVASNKQDIASAEVRFSPAPAAAEPEKDALRFGGALLVLAGLALAAALLARVRPLTLKG
jgi:hypothetical protein